MKFVTPLLGGVLGAAQLSTACVLSAPSSGTDVGITGVGGAYLLVSVPVGALLGTLLAYALLLRLPGRAVTWKEVGGVWLRALLLGVIAAPIAPGFLGLNPQTPAQLWQGFALEYSMAWIGLGIIAHLERRWRV